VVGATHSVVVSGQQLGRPVGLFAAGSGVVLIADFDQKGPLNQNGDPTQPGRILKWDQQAQQLTVVVPPATAGNPTDVVLDRTGNLYFPDYTSGTVHKLSRGSSTPALWATGFNDINYLAIDDGRARLYVSDFTDPTDTTTIHRRLRAVSLSNPKKIQSVAGNGQASGSALCPPGLGPQTASATSFVSISGSALYSDPTLGPLVYVGDQYEHVVYQIRLKTGQLYRYAGVCDPGTTPFLGDGDGGPATSAHVPYPQGLAVDRCGNLYILQIQGQVRRVDVSTGTITTVYNSWPVASDSNTDVVFDPSDGSLYVSSQDAQTLTRIT
jgi:hypothetical protein